MKMTGDLHHLVQIPWRVDRRRRHVARSLSSEAGIEVRCLERKLQCVSPASRVHRLSRGHRAEMGLQLGHHR